MSQARAADRQVTLAVGQPGPELAVEPQCCRDGLLLDSAGRVLVERGRQRAHVPVVLTAKQAEPTAVGTRIGRSLRLGEGLLRPAGEADRMPLGFGLRPLEVLDQT